MLACLFTIILIFNNKGRPDDHQAARSINMIILDYISLVLAIGMMVWGGYLLLKKSNIRKARYLAIFVFLMGGWMMCAGAGNLSGTAEQLLFYTRMCLIVSLGALLFFLFFIQVFRDRRTRLLQSNFMIIFLFIFFVALVIYADREKLLTGIEITFDSPAKGIPNQNYTFYFLGLTMLIMLKCVYFLFKDIGSLSLRKRTQIKYVCLGAGVFIFGAIIFDVLLPWILKDERFYSIGPMFSIFLIIFTSYAIFRYRLLDIKMIIQKSIVYTLLLSLIIIFYLAFAFVIGYFIQQRTDAIVIAGALTTILGIFSVPPIQRYFNKLTDRIFFKNKYNYGEAMQSLCEVLNKNLSLEALLKNIVVNLEAVLKVNGVRVYLVENKFIFDNELKFRPPLIDLPDEFIELAERKPLSIIEYSYLPVIIDREKDERNKKALKFLLKICREYSIEIIVPLFFESKMIGIILLGGKKSGDLYFREDIDFLNTFAYQAAMALENSHLYEKVKGYSKDLEKKVTKRTEELTRLQSDQEKMMVEISHGLQTPLTVLKGELEFMQKQMPDNYKLKNFERSIDRISKLMTDLLELSRMENAAYSLKKERTDLSFLLEEMVEYFSVVLNEKKIEVESRIEAGIFIFGNRDKLEELVINLVSNAMKYIGKGDRIVIRLGKKDEKIILAVEDNGMGIAAEDIPHIFERFYRNKNLSRIKGSGIGLAVCKRIAELHNGKISVASEVGKGTRFMAEF